MATTAELNFPVGLGVDTAGDLFISDPGASVVRRVDGATGLISTVAGNGTSGYSGDGGPALSAQFNTAYGLTVDAAGNLLYLVDWGNNVLRLVVF